MDRPWESCTFPIQQWTTSDINNPLVSHCFLFMTAVKSTQLNKSSSFA